MKPKCLCCRPTHTDACRASSRLAETPALWRLRFPEGTLSSPDLNLPLPCGAGITELGALSPPRGYFDQPRLPFQNQSCSPAFGLLLNCCLAFRMSVVPGSVWIPVTSSPKLMMTKLKCAGSWLGAEEAEPVQSGLT